jgi:hypothetical protein
VVQEFDHIEVHHDQTQVDIIHLQELLQHDDMEVDILQVHIQVVVKEDDMRVKPLLVQHDIEVIRMYLEHLILVTEVIEVIVVQCVNFFKLFNMKKEKIIVGILFILLTL